MPTSLVGKVTFFSDGVHVVLGPTGWTCSSVTPGAGGADRARSPAQPRSSTTTVATAPSTVPTAGQGAAIAAPGGTTLAVYPPNDPNCPRRRARRLPGAEGIFATYATTGSNAGVDLVCPYFTIPSWQSQQAGCSTTRPFGETTNVLTPDVTQVTDPAGLVGGVAASGGQGAVTGVVLFPQVPSAVSYGSPVAVAAESCSLADVSAVSHGPVGLRGARVPRARRRLTPEGRPATERAKARGPRDRGRRTGHASWPTPSGTRIRPREVGFRRPTVAELPRRPPCVR